MKTKLNFIAKLGVLSTVILVASNYTNQANEHNTIKPSNLSFVTTSFFENVTGKTSSNSSVSEKKAVKTLARKKEKLPEKNRLKKAANRQRTIPQKVSPTDNDGDGVPNNVDIDDDNDGVLDVNESTACGLATQSPWTRINGCSIDPGGCRFGEATATYSGGIVANLTSTSGGGWAGIGVSNYEANLINNNVGNVHKITFSQPVTDPQLYFWSIGNSSVTSFMTFSGLNISKISGSGGVSGNVVYGTEQDCRIKITGTFTSITFTTTSGYSTNYETTGIQLDIIGQCTPKDTDGDGIPDSFDLDSDNDGCSDAIEAGSSKTATSITVFPTGTDSNNNGLLDIYEGTTAGTVNYSSSYSQFALDGGINACLDSDGDGIKDVFDIDDDNDGVLDTDENNCEAITNGTFTGNSSGWIVNGEFPIATYLSSLNKFPFNSGAATPAAGSIYQKLRTFPGVTYKVTYKVGAAGTPSSNLTVGVKAEAVDDVTGLTISTPKITTRSGLLTEVDEMFMFTATGNFTRIKFTDATSPTMAVANLDPTVDDVSVVSCDTDNDGKPNSVDLDSDGDGCSDAIEAGSSSTSTSTTVFPSGADTNLNGLLNTYEGTPAGTINYQSFYTINALSSTTDGCLDTDGDGIRDFKDIDDDNDGILDTVENFCANAPISKTGVVVSKPATINYTFNGSYTINNIIDGIDNNVYIMHSPTGTLNNSPWLHFEFPTPKVLGYLEIGHYSGQTLFATTSTYKIQGSTDNTNWIDVSDVLTYNNQTTSVSGGLSNYNSNIAKLPLNITAYKYYRIYGIAGATGGGWATELYFKQNDCQLDRDNDNIPNSLDLDSDGDGCSDAIESGSSSTATSTMTYPTGTDTNSNGLLNNYESSVPGIINFTSYYELNALSNSVNGCVDFDGDGVSDFKDVDDDNDGVLDVVEASCQYNLTHDVLAEQGSASSFTTCSGSIDGPGIAASGFVSAPQAAYGTKYIGFHEAESFSVNLGTTPMVANVPFTVNITTSVASIVAWASNNPAYVNIYATNDCNKTEFIGSTTIRENQAQGWVFNTFNFTPSQNYSKLLFVAESPLSTGFEQGKTGYTLVDNISFGEVCNFNNDNDNDGIINIHDLDSDNDQCSDAIESGATTSIVPNYTFPAPYGANGFANSKETTPESGVINYISTYASFALTNSVTSCQDFDGDGIFDVVDIDDDNDGVLDIVESPNCFYQPADATVIESITSSLTTPDDDQTDQDIQLLHDGNITTYTVNFDAGQNLTGANIFTVVYPTPVLVSTLTLVNNTTFGTAVTAKLQGSANGINWIDISAIVSLSTAANKVFTNTSTTEYKYYRVLGVAGGTTLITTTIAEVTATYNTTNYQLAAHLKPSCTDDHDADGFPNHLDLNSDGDSCSDAFEASATTSATENYAFPGPYGANGLANSLETAIDSGVINYSSTYLTNALITAIASCTDSDSDGYADIYDLDDDNDGVLDDEEDNCSGVLVPSTDGASKSQVMVAPGWIASVSSPDVADVTSHPYGAWSIGCTGTVPSPPNGHTDWIAATSPTGETFKTTLNNLVVGKTYYLKVYYGKFGYTGYPPGQVTAKIGTTVIDQYTPLIGCGWDTKVLPFTATAISQDLSFSAATVGNNMINISIAPNAITTFCDNDKDGIPNSLDLDSDGDGCNDAIEGGTNILLSSLLNSTMNGGNSGTAYIGTSTTPVVQNLGNVVGTTLTTLGVPTIAGSGQTIGFSQEPTINTCADKDGDDVVNYDDIDDDNDGVADIFEMY